MFHKQLSTDVEVLSGLRPESDKPHDWVYGSVRKRVTHHMSIFVRKIFMQNWNVPLT